jgi:hypothetical protein
MIYEIEKQTKTNEHDKKYYLWLRTDGGKIIVLMQCIEKPYVLNNSLIAKDEYQTLNFELYYGDTVKGN